MKRIVLLFSGILVSSATLFAQSGINIYVQGQSGVVNDSTITVFGAVNSAHQILLAITNTKPLSANIKAKYQVSSPVASAQNSFCWGTQCYGQNSAPYFEASSPDVIGGNKTDSTFSGHYYDNGHTGIESVRYTFFNAADSADSSTVVIRYVITPLGIPQVAANALHISAPYPNPAKSNVSFNYSLNGSSQASLEVYNTLGQNVQSLTVTNDNNRLSLNVSDFPAGIYICKLEAGGTEPVFQKLIVTH